MSNERVISMSGKKMYSTELKLEIVKRYLEGNIGLKALAEQYHVNKGDIQNGKQLMQNTEWMGYVKHTEHILAILRSLL